jgi:hypothetical protein
MKKYIPYIIIAVFLALLVFRKNETTVITIPEKKGSFEQNDPEPIVHYDTIREAGETKIKEVPNPINQELLAQYNSLKDSIAKQKFVEDAITERIYRETYQDSIQRITVETEVIGSMKSQKVDYTVFEQQAEIRSPESRTRLDMGVFTSIPTNGTNAPSIGTRLNLMTPKRTYSLGYDNQHNITAGIAFKLF